MMERNILAIFFFTVTLAVDPSNPIHATYSFFEGILVQARRADCSSSTPVGQFTSLGDNNDGWKRFMDCNDLSQVSYLRH